MAKIKCTPRKDILQFLVSQACVPAYDSLVDNQNLSSGYAKIPTDEVIIQLYHTYGWRVIGCGLQKPRRNEKKYDTDKTYRKTIDEKTRMAKHYVLLRCDTLPSNYRILLINGHKGNTALKLYCGAISEDSDIYGMQFTELIQFVSLRHNHENAHNLRSIITTFADYIVAEGQDLQALMKQKLMSQEEFEKQLLCIAEIPNPKQYLLKWNDLLNHFYKTKQEVWGYTYHTLLTFCTETLVNHFVRHRASHTISALEQHARLAMKIREYVVALYADKK